MWKNKSADTHQQKHDSQNLTNRLCHSLLAPLWKVWNRAALRPRLSRETRLSMTRCFRFGAPHVYQRGRPVAKIFLASDLTGKHRSDVFVRPWLLTYTIAQDLQIRGVGQ